MMPTARKFGLVLAAAVCSCSLLVGCGGGAPPAPPPGGDGTSPPQAQRVPLNDLGSGTYLGFSGGLYPGGSNDPPAAHAAAGVARASAIRRLDAAGNPDPNGSYILLSIGMSNTTQEFCGGSSSTNCTPWSFMGQAAADPAVRRDGLVIVDGAMGGRSASFWDSPADPDYDRIRDTILTPRGLSERQVQAVWMKVANPRPSVSLPAEQADAITLLMQMGNILRALKTRYPNLQLVFASSRIYAGFATTDLNPEPYAYESGFAVKWLIEAQIAQMAQGRIVDVRAGDLDYNTVAPWVGWGPYLWADGTRPRSDGLIWEPADFQNDGTHPSQSGEQKVGKMLLEFLKTSPFSRCWFTTNPCP